jgi:hypothetical protein
MKQEIAGTYTMPIMMVIHLHCLLPFPVRVQCVDEDNTPLVIGRALANY